MRRTIAALALLTAVSCGDDIAQRYARSSAAQNLVIDGVSPAERFSMMMELIDKLGG